MNTLKKTFTELEMKHRLSPKVNRGWFFKAEGVENLLKDQRDVENFHLNTDIVNDKEQKIIFNQLKDETSVITESLKGGSKILRSQARLSDKILKDDNDTDSLPTGGNLPTHGSINAEEALFKAISKGKSDPVRKATRDIKSVTEEDKGSVLNLLFK